MNEPLNRTIKTIDSREVAKMIEMPHSKLLRKLEGDKERKGYVQILNETQMGVVDYFIKSTYQDNKGEERPCYLFTKLGCDFIAHKFTGEKGVIFTARYVKKFQEMEQQLKMVTYPAKATSGSEVARLMHELRLIMNHQKSEPYEVAEMAQSICNQFGIMLPPNFVKVPLNRQLELEYLSK